MITIESGALVMLFLEGVKQLIKRFGKNPEFNFSPIFFAIVVPVLNALVPFLLVYGLGQQSDSPVLVMDLIGIVRYVLLIGLSSLISFMGYNVGIKPLKEYDGRVKAEKLALDKSNESGV
jgi:hypothetical protein